MLAPWRILWGTNLVSHSHKCIVPDIIQRMIVTRCSNPSDVHLYLERHITVNSIGVTRQFITATAPVISGSIT